MAISEDTTRAVEPRSSGSTTVAGRGDLDDELPERVGRYRLTDVLGRGGMGVVFEAHDPELGRPVAIKRLRSRVLGSSSAEVETERRRLVRESRALAALSHPNVIAVYDVIDDESGFHIVMELVKGITLRQWLEGAPPWPEVLALFLQAGRGLGAAHRVGLVHRDFKPSNVMVGEDGRARVLDFGLARDVGPGASGAERATGGERSSSSSSSLAVSSERTTGLVSLDEGMVVGTPAYMSPEQIQGLPLTHATDQFSFCVALFEGLYGQRPFPASRFRDRLVAIHRGPGPMPTRSEVPARLLAVLAEGMAYDPSQRFASMDALLRAAQRAVAPRVPRSLRWGALGLGMAAVAGGVGLALAPVAQAVPCEDGSQRVSELWNEEVRDEVGQRLGALERDYAADTAARVVDELDAWARAWASHRVAACEAEPERFDRVTACLERDLLALSAAVELLQEPDLRVLDNAAELLAGLPSPAACDHREPATRPPPPELRAQVDALRSRLAHAAALERAGHMSDARAVLEPLVEEARALGYPQALAEVQAVRSRVLRLLGVLDEASAAGEEAYFSARSGGDQLLAVEAATTLAITIGDGRGRPDDGLEWTQHGTAALERSSGSDPAERAEIQAELLNAIGTLRMRKGEHELARLQFEEARRVLDASPVPRPATMATVLHNLGSTLQELGELDLAEATELQSLELTRGVVGPEHPMCGSGHNSLGNIHALRGEAKPALRHYREAVRVWSKGEAQPYLGMAHYNIGRMLQVEGDLEGARESYEESIRVLEVVLGPEHPNLAMPIHNLGELHLGQGRYAEARTAAQRALEIFEGGQMDPLFLAYGRFNLARALRAESGPSERVGELARRAREGFVAAGASGEAPLADLQHWLDDPSVI